MHQLLPLDLTCSKRWRGCWVAKWSRAFCKSLFIPLWTLSWSWVIVDHRSVLVNFKELFSHSTLAIVTAESPTRCREWLPHLDMPFRLGDSCRELWGRSIIWMCWPVKLPPLDFSHEWVWVWKVRFFIYLIKLPGVDIRQSALWWEQEDSLDSLLCHGCKVGVQLSHNCVKEWDEDCSSPIYSSLLVAGILSHGLLGEDGIAGELALWRVVIFEADWKTFVLYLSNRFPFRVHVETPPFLCGSAYLFDGISVLIEGFLLSRMFFWLCR